MENSIMLTVQYEYNDIIYSISGSEEFHTKM